MTISQQFDKSMNILFEVSFFINIKSISNFTWIEFRIDLVEFSSERSSRFLRFRISRKYFHETFAFEDDEHFPTM